MARKKKEISKGQKFVAWAKRNKISIAVGIASATILGFLIYQELKSGDPAKATESVMVWKYWQGSPEGTPPHEAIQVFYGGVDTDGNQIANHIEVLIEGRNTEGMYSIHDFNENGIIEPGKEMASYIKYLQENNPSLLEAPYLVENTQTNRNGLYAIFMSTIPGMAAAAIQFQVNDVAKLASHYGLRMYNVAKTGARVGLEKICKSTHNLFKHGLQYKLHDRHPSPSI